MDITSFLKPYITGTILLITLSLSRGALAQEQPAFNSDMYGTVSAGLGYGKASVTPNTDHQFYAGGGLALGFGLAAEMQLKKPLTLAVRVDAFNSLDFSSAISDASASWGLMATAGIIIGNLQKPDQLFISASVGVGAAMLSDQGTDESGDSICFLCTGKEGGVSAGLAGRLAIGITRQSGVRIALVAMLVGGNGEDSTYSNGEDAFLQTILVQIIGKGT